jgi:tetratricopeptide (TPR) repeat protein
MANLLAIQGQASEAISVYRQAIRLNPKNASAYYNLGVTLYNQGDIKKANGVLKRAHTEYREQGNIEQAQKIEQLMQQIAQKIQPQQPQASQTATPSQTPDNTSNVIQTPEPQTPNQLENPVSVEQQSTSTSSGQ